MRMFLITALTSSTLILAGGVSSCSKKSDGGGRSKGGGGSAPPSGQISGTLALEKGASLNNRRVLVQTFDNKQYTGSVQSDGKFAVEGPPPGTPFTLMIQDGTANLLGSSVSTIAAVSFGDLGFAQSFESDNPISLNITADTRMKSASAEVASGDTALTTSKSETLPDVGGAWNVSCVTDKGLGSSCSGASDALPSGFYLAQNSSQLSLWKSEDRYNACSSSLNAAGIPSGSVSVYRYDQGPPVTERVNVDFSTDVASRASIASVFAKFPAVLKANIINFFESTTANSCETAYATAGDPACVVDTDASSPFHNLFRFQIDGIIRLVAEMMNTYDDPYASPATKAPLFDENCQFDCASRLYEKPSWVSSFADCHLDVTAYDSMSGTYYNYVHDGDVFPNTFCQAAYVLKSRILVASDYYATLSRVQSDGCTTYGGCVTAGHNWWDYIQNLVTLNGQGKFVFADATAPRCTIVPDVGDYDSVSNPTGHIADSSLDQLSCTNDAPNQPAIYRAGFMTLGEMRAVCPTFAATKWASADSYWEDHGQLKETINYRDCFAEFGSMTIAQQLAAVSKMGYTKEPYQAWTGAAMGLAAFVCFDSDTQQMANQFASQNCVPDLLPGTECVNLDVGLGYPVSACGKTLTCETGMGGGCDFSSAGFLGTGSVESFGEKGAAVSTFTNYTSTSFLLPDAVASITNSDMYAVCSQWGIPSSSCNSGYDVSCTHKDALTFVANPKSSSEMLVTLTKSQGSVCTATESWGYFPGAKGTPKRSSSQKTFLFELSK